jgi:predicted neuraminidase
MGLLLSSFVVILGSMGQAEAQEAEASSGDVSVASGSNRFVIWQDTAGPGPGDIYLKRSTDNGATWKASVNLSNNPGGSFNPKLAVSGASVFVVWSQSNADGTATDVILKRSTNNGVTWKANQKITPGGTCTAAPCHSIDSLTASGTNLYLVTEKSGDIFLRRSSDNGATWKTPVNISSNAGRSSNSEIAVSGTNVYLTWFQANTANTSHDILFRRSADSGATWKSKVNLSNDPGFSHSPDIAASGSNVYVTWNGEVTFPDERTFMGILFKNSNDGGATWTSVKVLSDYPIHPDPSNDGQLVGASSPRVVSSGSNVYMAWFDNVFSVEKSSGSMDVVFRRSLDGGNSWDPVVVVDDASPSEGCGQIELAILGTTAYVAWLLTDEGCNRGGIEFSRSTDNGATWSPPRTMIDVFLKATLRSPLILAVSDSSVFLVIARDMGGPGSDIFIARSTDSGVTWPAAINLSKLSGVSNNPAIGL